MLWGPLLTICLGAVTPQTTRPALESRPESASQPASQMRPAVPLGKVLEVQFTAGEAQIPRELVFRLQRQSGRAVLLLSAESDDTDFEVSVPAEAGSWKDESAHPREVLLVHGVSTEQPTLFHITVKHAGVVRLVANQAAVPDRLRDCYRRFNAMADASSTAKRNGDLAAARRQSRAFLEEVLAATTGDERPAAHAALQSLGQLAMRFSDWDTASVCFRELIRIAERTLPLALLHRAYYLGLEAGLADERGESARAVQLIDSALAAQRARLGPDHIAVLRTEQQRIGIALHANGDILAAKAGSEALYQVMAGRSDVPKDLLLRTRIALANSLRKCGDDVAARAHLESALEQSRKDPALPFRTHFDVRTQLAELLLTARDARNATLLADEAETLSRPQKFPPDHPERRTLEGLQAGIASARGDHALAEASYRALAEAPDLPKDVHAFVNWANELRALDRSREAIAAIQRILPGLARRHRESALAFLVEAGGHARDKATVAEWVPKLVDDIWGNLRPALAQLTPRAAAETLRLHQLPIDILLAYGTGWATDAPDSKLEEVFTLIETCRRLDTNAYRWERMGESLSQSDAAIVRQLRADLDQARERAVANPTLVAIEAKEQAEQRLSARLRALPGGRSVSEVTSTQELARNLAPNEAAVGYWRYYRFTPDTNLFNPGAVRMLAFVLTASGDLRRVEIGTFKEIGALCEDYRRAVFAGRDADAAEVGDRLRALVWDPVVAAAPGKQRWLVALDGPLHAVPLDALPAKALPLRIGPHAIPLPSRALPEGGKLVGDSCELIPVTSLRELAERTRPIATAQSLFTMAAVDYDRLPSRTSESRPLAATRRRAEVADSGATTYGFQPNSEPEAEAIRTVFAQWQTSGVPVRTLTGVQATKDRLRDGVAGARFVHVITHGWNAPETVRSSADDDSTQRVAFGAAEIRGMLPLSLCGLVLAGANLPVARDTAFLTAEELATFDLTACELAVLSACGTHVGVSRVGQGVASLQRALHAAGARASITSLWEVDDKAAQELMVEFYRCLWQGGRSRSAALWQAKEHLRRMRTGNGEFMYGLRHWAAWVLTESP